MAALRSDVLALGPDWSQKTQKHLSRGHIDHSVLSEFPNNAYNKLFNYFYCYQAHFNADLNSEKIQIIYDFEDVLHPAACC